LDFYSCALSSDTAHRGAGRVDGFLARHARRRSRRARAPKGVDGRRRRADPPTVARWTGLSVLFVRRSPSSFLGLALSFCVCFVFGSDFEFHWGARRVSLSLSLRLISGRRASLRRTDPALRSRKPIYAH
jgi:hypothetical protein